MKWLFNLIGFKEIEIIAADDIGNITIRATTDPIYVKGDTVWVKKGYRYLE